ncbi:MAG: hypothetical protein QXP04_00335 [Candidatus Nanoarchaeia archaeon]|nr:hypothetical protein [Candidatus Jingweiarchaeum tengchongense]
MFRNIIIFSSSSLISLLATLGIYYLISFPVEYLIFFYSILSIGVSTFLFTFFLERTRNPVIEEVRSVPNLYPVEEIIPKNVKQKTNGVSKIKTLDELISEIIKNSVGTGSFNITLKPKQDTMVNVLNKQMLMEGEINIKGKIDEEIERLKHEIESLKNMKNNKTIPEISISAEELLGATSKREDEKAEDTGYGMGGV